MLKFLKIWVSVVCLKVLVLYDEEYCMMYCIPSICMSLTLKVLDQILIHFLDSRHLTLESF